MTRDFVGGMKPRTDFSIELWCGRIDFDPNDGTAKYPPPSPLGPDPRPYPVKEGFVYLGDGHYRSRAHYHES